MFAGMSQSSRDQIAELGHSFVQVRMLLHTYDIEFYYFNL